jgi:hypothetical protein
MMNFRVTAERAPLRCDICHQADCFDAVTGYCLRCEDIAIRLLGNDVSPGASRIPVSEPYPNLRAWWSISSPFVFSILMLGGVLLCGLPMLVGYLISTPPLREQWKLSESSPPGVVRLPDRTIQAWNLSGQNRLVLSASKGIVTIPVREVSGIIVMVDDSVPPSRIVIQEKTGHRLFVQVENSVLSRMDKESQIGSGELLCLGQVIKATCLAFPDPRNCLPTSEDYYLEMLAERNNDFSFLGIRLILDALVASRPDPQWYKRIRETNQSDLPKELILPEAESREDSLRLEDLPDGGVRISGLTYLSDDLKSNPSRHQSGTVAGFLYSNQNFLDVIGFVFRNRRGKETKMYFNFSREFSKSWKRLQLFRCLTSGQPLRISTRLLPSGVQVVEVIENLPVNHGKPPGQ